MEFQIDKALILEAVEALEERSYSRGLLMKHENTNMKNTKRPKVAARVKQINDAGKAKAAKLPEAREEILGHYRKKARDLAHTVDSVPGIKI